MAAVLFPPWTRSGSNRKSRPGLPPGVNGAGVRRSQSHESELERTGLGLRLSQRRPPASPRRCDWRAEAPQPVGSTDKVRKATGSLRRGCGEQALGRWAQGLGADGRGKHGSPGCRR